MTTRVITPEQREEGKREILRRLNELEAYKALIRQIQEVLGTEAQWGDLVRMVQNTKNAEMKLAELMLKRNY